MTRVRSQDRGVHRGAVTDDPRDRRERMIPMKSIAIVTPTYAPDYAVCVDLHRSMLRFADDSVVHYLIVPPKDVELFKSLRGPRCIVLAADEFLPKRMIWVAPWVNHVVRLAWGNRPSANLVALNPVRPFPPVRGWIMQQILKLAAAIRLDADILLLVDSDVQFVRPISSDTLVRNGRLRQYRRDGTVGAHLPEHVAWHKTARELLGLPAPKLPLPDYVSALNVWDRRVVLALLDRIERITHRHWIDVLGGQLTFSEHILYGVFVDEVLGPSANTFVTSSLCHSYWDTSPLDETSAATFLRDLSADDVAILIQSKSGTPLEIRRSAFARLMASAPE
jgi:hypothetical protein